MAELEVTKVEEKEITSQEELEKVLADPSTNKPSDEEKIQFKEDFEKAVEEFNNKKWAISKDNDTFKTLNYLNDFIKNKAYWNNNVWMGLIKMNETIEELYKTSMEGKALEVSYHPLEFLAYILQNGISGVGVQSALDFEKVADKHIIIAEYVMDALTNAREMIKEVQYLQEKWIAAEQGFYLVREDGVAEEDQIESKVSDELKSK